MTTNNLYNLNSGMRCVKYMLLIINFMFIVTAILLMFVGTTIQTIFTDFVQFIDDHFFSPPALLVAIGGIMLLVSSFGCFGAMKESTLLINIYGLFLFFIFILEIAAAIAAFSLQSDVREMLARKIGNSMAVYPTNPAIAKDIDFMQTGLACCGISGPDDWNKVEGDLPNSCCELPGDEYCIKTYENGCLKHMEFLIKQSAMLIATGATTVAFVQFLGVLCAFMLAKTIRRNKSLREARRWQLQQNLGILVNGGFNHNGQLEKNVSNVSHDIGYTQMEKTGDRLERSDPITYTADSPSVN